MPVAREQSVPRSPRRRRTFNGSRLAAQRVVAIPLRRRRKSFSGIAEDCAAIRRASTGTSSLAASWSLCGCLSDASSRLRAACECCDPARGQNRSAQWSSSAVSPATAMNARGDEHVVPAAMELDAAQSATESTSWVAGVAVFAAPGRNLRTARPRAVLGFEAQEFRRGDRPVYVEGDESAQPQGHADIRVGPGVPPVSNLVWRAARALYTAAAQWMFRRRSASSLPARAFPRGESVAAHRVHRKHIQARGRVAQGFVEWDAHARPQLLRSPSDLRDGDSHEPAPEVGARAAPGRPGVRRRRTERCSRRLRKATEHAEGLTR